MATSKIIDLQPIFLIGFMGTGKSTVGPLLSQKLGRRFVDLDAVVEEEAHMTVAEIFFNEREAGFRQREARALARVAKDGPQVISVGGGAPAHGDNLELMLATGMVVCLTATVDELLRRIGSAESRPMLAAATDVRGEIERLLARRQPFYARAHVICDTTGVIPSKVARSVIEGLERL